MSKYLPPRIMEAARLRAKGLSAKKIAELMGIKVETVEHYLYLADGDHYIRHIEWERQWRRQHPRSLKSPFRVCFAAFGGKGPYKRRSKLVEMFKREGIWQRVKYFNTREEMLNYIKQLIVKYADFFKDRGEKHNLTFWLHNHVLLSKDEIKKIYREVGLGEVLKRH